MLHLFAPLLIFLALGVQKIHAQTFGNGLAGVPICGSSHPPTVIINYTIPSGSTHGVLHHFWTTGTAQLIDRIIIDYFLDGETSPSISFQPSMMCGLQFPGFIAHDYEYSAGGLCGKTAPVGGYSNVFPVPFYKHALVTARANPLDGPEVCLGGYLSVRGTLNLPLVVPGSGRPLPFGSRLILQSNPPQNTNTGHPLQPTSRAQSHITAAIPQTLHLKALALSTLSPKIYDATLLLYIVHPALTSYVSSSGTGSSATSLVSFSRPP